jgi:hypothetical protein
VTTPSCPGLRLACRVRLRRRRSHAGACLARPCDRAHRELALRVTPGPLSASPPAPLPGTTRAMLALADPKGNGWERSRDELGHTRRRDPGACPPGRGPGGGLAPGGWGIPYGGEAAVTQVGERLAKLTGEDHAWLFGGWSSESILASWNARGGPFKDAPNLAHEYVGSGSPGLRGRGPLPRGSPRAPSARRMMTSGVWHPTPATIDDGDR